MGTFAFRISCFIILTTVSWSLLAQKTDKVFLKNGDQITGEIKSMKFAKLGFDMTGPGLIQIKWEEIIKLISDKSYEITTKKGNVYITKLDVLFSENPQLVLDDIVEIVQIKDKFLQRLDGDVNLGFNYAKSNSIFQLNFNTSITYRRPKAETNLKLNTILSKSSNDSILARKQDAALNYYRKLNHNLLLISTIGWEKNTQLGLLNRFLLNGGAGKIFVNNNHQNLIMGGGLSFNVEQSRENISYKKNLESLFTIQFKQFRYSTPKLSLDATYTIYPSLSDWGRVRMNFNINSKVELFKDFFAGLIFYDTYDNRPPQGATSKNDYGVNFSLGYEFGK